MSVAAQSRERRSSIPDMLPHQEQEPLPGSGPTYTNPFTSSSVSLSAADEQLLRTKLQSQSQLQFSPTDDGCYDLSIIDDAESAESEYEDANDMSPSEMPVTFETATALQVPALPVRSARRSVATLESLSQKQVRVEQPALSQRAPHEVYMSSEEDASSSADDFSDFDFESDSDLSPGSPSSRCSHEDTARVVSVIFSGKPSIVQLPSRSISPSSTATSLDRTMTEPVMAQSASENFTSSTTTRPARTSSRSSEFMSHIKSRTSFLDEDPYAMSRVEEQKRVKNGMLKKTMSLMKKKSKPALNQPVALPYDAMMASAAPTSRGIARRDDRSYPPRRSQTMARQPTMREQETSRPTTSSRNKILTGLASHSRRNSIIRL